jgi:hypothetical protein
MRYLIWLGVAIPAVVFVGFVGFTAERHLFSNMERDLSLNSGRRESSELINFSNILTQCESAQALIASIGADLEAAKTEAEKKAYAKYLLDLQLAKTQCLGRLQSIIDTTEIENVPEFQSLNLRYLAIQ